MSYLFPSAEWVAAFKDALNASEAYKVSAQNGKAISISSFLLERACQSPSHSILTCGMVNAVKPIS